jgi:ATP-dependent helicase STH1/SNF2
LRTLLDRENEDTEEDAEPDEDTLNEIIARSEEEMELFTKMDEERKQREISQLPRLITKEELPEPYTREYPPASELAIEAIEEDFGRGQRSRTTVNYQEQNDLDDLLMEPMDDDAEPLPARRNRKPKGQLPDTKLDQDHSRPVSPAKLSAFEEQDLEGSAGPSNRGRKRKEPSTTASNADEETKPAKVSANRRSSTRIRGSHSDHFLFLGNRSDLDSRMMAGLLLRLMSLLRCAPYRTECGITRTRMVLISCGLSRQKFPKR